MDAPRTAPPTPHPAWGARELWLRLAPVLPGIGVEVLAEVDSTNSELLARARHGRRAADLAPCLLVAEHQRAGRGRLGRPWRTLPGGALTFSLALPMAPRGWGGLSLAVGTALADALDPPDDGAPSRIGIKWPNDLWLLDARGGGRKLGGVLIETSGAVVPRWVVVGVGINVLPRQVDATEFSTGYGCLREIDPHATAPAALATVVEPLARALRLFEADGLAPFAARFAARDLLRGRTVTTSGAEGATGVADGIDEDGALSLRCADGLRRVSSGEVSVRLAGERATPAGSAC
ncbi:MAG: biotin--[acetyl-CoA-carboxylase] ligase [Rubrivivax sp.]|nr:biotin--[acetyl-CoA-carboxylase] ligase [Rubrivivax sp.]